ncbi:MAG: hypothetical protein O2971_16775 [Proteobacteria bacterium]|nr:hypothetical protein [Pseudomonadota bacterium]
MSLLMDALRKAEESKKKAEQENKSAAESEKLQSQAGADEQQVAASTPGESAPIETARQIEQDTSQTPAGNIPDTMLEFEESEQTGSLIDDIGEESEQTSSLSDDIGEESEQTSSLSDDIGEESESTADLELQPQFEKAADAEILEESYAEQYSASLDQEAIEQHAVEEEENQAHIQERELTSEEEVPASLELSADDHDALFSIPQPKAETIVEKTAGSRLAAKSVFDAKRPSRRNRQNFMMAGMGIAAVVVLGFGFYFYVSVSTDSGIAVPVNYVARQDAIADQAEPDDIEPELTSALTEPATPVESIAAAEVILAQPVDEPVIEITPTAIANSLQPTIASSQVISQVIGEVNAPEPPAPVSSPQREPAAPVVATSRFVEATTTEVTGQLATAEARPVIEPAAIAPNPATIQPVNLISFQRRQSVSSIDPLVEQAYSAYQAGNLNTARDLYQRALLGAAQHRDALLGLAAIAAAENNTIEAMELYSRLLSRDPSDPVARAGFLELRPNGNAAEQERELKRLLEIHSSVAPLVYALGNFYASQQNWSQAQQYYFNALQLARSNALAGSQVNPDYAFNLAVSLEHLRQADSAQNYYRAALEYAENHPAGFDLNMARTRLENLSRTSAR